MSKELNIDSSISTMSSIEISKLTGKRHGNVIRDIEKMLKELDSNLSRAMFSSTYTDSNGASRKCYNLPKRECLILVSGYNIKMRASIIDRWQELEAKPEPQPANGLPMPENYINSAQLLADMFNIQGAEKLKLASNILINSGHGAIAKALPSYENTKFVGTNGEVSARVAHAYTYLKNKHDLPISAIAFNRLAVAQGFLSEETTSAGKKFKAVTEKGLYYGKNMVANESTSTTQPHWYDDTFLGLFDLVCPA